MAPKRLRTRAFFGVKQEKEDNMSKEGQERITFRTSAKTRFAIEQLMGDEGSRSMNEFIEHAVNHYIDHILMTRATTLPKAISSAIDGRLGMLEDRLSALQFNNSAWASKSSKPHNVSNN